jgi:hypothetical protein
MIAYVARNSVLGSRDSSRNCYGRLRFCCMLDSRTSGENRGIFCVHFCSDLAQMFLTRFPSVDEESPLPFGNLGVRKKPRQVVLAATFRSHFSVDRPGCLARY